MNQYEKILLANQIEPDTIDLSKCEQEQNESFNFSKRKNKLFDVIQEIIKNPCIIGIVGDANEGKSNLILWLLSELRKNYNLNVVHYGLNSAEDEIYSIEELERIKNSVIFIDEMPSLFDLENRKCRRLIEKTIRRVFHNNNALFLCGLPENFKKFISAKLQMMIFKKVSLYDLINGTSIKNVLLSYHGLEMGSSVLELDKKECIFYDGLHFSKSNIPYMEKFDLKTENVSIIVSKFGTKSVS